PARAPLSTRDDPDRTRARSRCPRNGHSNLERGARKPSPENLRLLDSTLRTGGQLERLWNELKDSGQLAWLGKLSELEQEATSILEFQNQLIPSLLQTEPYAQMVIKAVSPWKPNSWVEANAKARIQRADRFTSASSPVMFAVLSTTILTNPVDSGPVMREQLAHLHDLISRGRVAVQFIDPGRHPGLVGPFKILAPASGPEVAYTESAYKGQFVDVTAAVAEFKLRFGCLQAEALPPGRSLVLVSEALERMNDE